MQAGRSIKGEYTQDDLCGIGIRLQACQIISFVFDVRVKTPDSIIFSIISSKRYNDLAHGGLKNCDPKGMYTNILDFWLVTDL